MQYGSKGRREETKVNIHLDFVYNATFACIALLLALQTKIYNLSILYFLQISDLT